MRAIHCRGENRHWFHVLTNDKWQMANEGLPPGVLQYKKSCTGPSWWCMWGYKGGGRPILALPSHTSNSTECPCTAPAPYHFGPFRAAYYSRLLKASVSSRKWTSYQLCTSTYSGHVTGSDNNLKWSVGSSGSNSHLLAYLVSSFSNSWTHKIPPKLQLRWRSENFLKFGFSTDQCFGHQASINWSPLDSSVPVTPQRITNCREASSHAMQKLH